MPMARGRPQLQLRRPSRWRVRTA